MSLILFSLDRNFVFILNHFAQVFNRQFSNVSFLNFQKKISWFKKEPMMRPLPPKIILSYRGVIKGRKPKVVQIFSCFLV